MLDCLIGAVGLTRSENPCIISGLTAEQIARLRLSKSGLYLDEMENGLSWQAIKSTDYAKSYYQQVTQAQDKAIHDIETLLLQKISLRYTQGKKRFAGVMGERKMTASLPNLQRWQGLRFRPNDDTNAVLTIKKITGAFNAAGFIDYMLLKVPYDSTTGEIVKTWAGNAINANTWNEVTAFEPLMQMFTGENRLYEYYFVYNMVDTMATAQPKNNELTCNCSGSEAMKPGQFAQVQGVSFDAVIDPMQPEYIEMSNIQSDNFAHGLLVDIEINCGASDLICKEYQNKPEVYATINDWLRNKMQALLIISVLNSNETSRYTTMDKENLLRNLGIFRSYDKYADFLIESIDINEAGGCFTCKQRTNQPIKRTIFM